MTAKVVGTLSILNIVETIANVGITVAKSLDWFILLVSPEERISSSFESCSIPL